GAAPPSGLDAVEPRHPHVHQDHIRVERVCELERLDPVRGLADELDVGAGVEDHPEAAANERLVVGDEDADAQGASESGKRAATAKPPPGAGPADSEPPKTPTRSRIPIRPRPLPPPFPEPSSRTSTSSASAP